MSTLTAAEREVLSTHKRGGHPRKYNTTEEIQQAQEVRRIKDREEKRLKRSLSLRPTPVSIDSCIILSLHLANILHIYI